ncbi:hypothetical protein AB0I60_14900 [Actinosynnema sp. NPDC050436]|uniref:hypothetical protein n=1 Tax=Actinosynnema sp. NPDC050436 TaxID=3155659 RepID=UPI0033E17249
MDDETRRKKNAVPKIGLVVLGVLVLLGAVQALTTGAVGVGSLSVTFRSSAPTTTPPVDGVVTSTTSLQPPPVAVETKVAVGTWKQTRGLLTVEVTRVENAGGRLRLHVTVVNASTAKMDLPTASISAVDDGKRNYSASLATSRWPVTVAKNAATSGYVELDPEVTGSATVLTVTFGGIGGQLAPTGGAVAVADVPVPR